MRERQGLGMIIVPIIEDKFEPTGVVQFDVAGYPDVTAIALRPGAAAMAAVVSNLTAALFVERHLIAIEGLEMVDEEHWTVETPWSTSEPYDHDNPRHFKSLPFEMCRAICDALLSGDPEPQDKAS